MSPRRSSRARTTQPPPSVTGAPSIASSSTSSSRGERASRTNHKQSSPQKSSTPHSLSSEEIDEPLRGSQVEPPQTRRRTRGQDNDDDDETTKLEDELDDDIAEEDEVTRCLCGMQEYPGPPSDAGKTKDGQLSALGDADIPGEDAGGLFIQCDICKVWQHGGCVGIMEEAASPDEYFCEECRKDLHKVMISSKGCVIFHSVASALYLRRGSVENTSHASAPKPWRLSTKSSRPLDLRLANQFNDANKHLCIGKSTRDTFPSTTNITTRMLANHPFLKTPTAKRSRTGSASLGQAWSRSANAGQQ
jgi:hypothetical protein